MILRKIRVFIERPFLKIKWWFTKEKKIGEIKLKSTRVLFNKRDEIYKKYLEADRQDRKDDSLTYVAYLACLDYVLGKIDEL